VPTINIVLMVCVLVTLVSLEKTATLRHVPTIVLVMDTALTGRAIAALVGLAMIVPRKCVPMIALEMVNVSMPHASASHLSLDSIAHC